MRGIHETYLINGAPQRAGHGVYRHLGRAVTRRIIKLLNGVPKIVRQAVYLQRIGPTPVGLLRHRKLIGALVHRKTPGFITTADADEIHLKGAGYPRHRRGIIKYFGDDDAVAGNGGIFLSDTKRGTDAQIAEGAKICSKSHRRRKAHRKQQRKQSRQERPRETAFAS
jgi:hypothetical protein